MPRTIQAVPEAAAELPKLPKLPVATELNHSAVSPAQPAAAIDTKHPRAKVPSSPVSRESQVSPPPQNSPRSPPRSPPQLASRSSPPRSPAWNPTWNSVVQRVHPPEGSLYGLATAERKAAPRRAASRIASRLNSPHPHLSRFTPRLSPPASTPSPIPAPPVRQYNIAVVNNDDVTPDLPDPSALPRIPKARSMVELRSIKRLPSRPPLVHGAAASSSSLRTPGVLAAAPASVATAAITRTGRSSSSSNLLPALPSARLASHPPLVRGASGALITKRLTLSEVTRLLEAQRWLRGLEKREVRAAGRSACVCTACVPTARV